MKWARRILAATLCVPLVAGVWLWGRSSTRVDEIRLTLPGHRLVRVTSSDGLVQFLTFAPWPGGVGVGWRSEAHGPHTSAYTAAAAMWPRQENATVARGRQHNDGRGWFAGTARLAMNGGYTEVGELYWQIGRWRTVVRWLAVPPVVGLVGWGVPVVVRRVRARQRRLRGQCPQCGYDLRESPGVCPECGARDTASKLAG